MKNPVYIGLTLFLLLSCWHKQDHNVTRPQIPHYTLSGTTVDYLTGEPVPNITINIIGSMMLYDVTFNSMTVQSDSAGRYTINPVYPGGYYMYLVHDGCHLHEHKLSIEHADRELDLQVTKIMHTIRFPNRVLKNSNFGYSRSNSNKPCFHISGIKAVFPSTLQKSEYVPPTFYFCKADYNLRKWVFDEAKEIDIDPHEIYQLTKDNQCYYALKSDSLLVFDQFSPKVPTSYYAGLNLVDIAYNIYDKTLYACTDSLLYRIDRNPIHFQELAPLPKSGFSSMTWNDNSLYFYHKHKDLLFKIDLQLQMTEVYTLINSSGNNFIKNVYDINFDSYDNLWVRTGP